MIYQNKFIQESLLLAQKAASLGEIPVGALIVDYDKEEIITACHNQDIKLGDPTAHAEMLAIQQATRKLGRSRLTNCDIYVSLEPCAMCAAAIGYARFRRLYFAAYDPKFGAVEHGAQIFNYSHHIPEIYGGLHADEAKNIMQNFFQKLRKDILS